jgi:hypothetical protein
VAEESAATEVSPPVVESPPVEVSAVTLPVSIGVVVESPPPASASPRVSSPHDAGNKGMTRAKAVASAVAESLSTAAD